LTLLPGALIVSTCIALAIAEVAISLPGTEQPASGPIVFENVSERARVPFIANNSASEKRHQPETMLAGVAVFDYNNDGWPDIFFANGAALPGMDKSDPRFFNRLYRNNKDGTFTDVTDQAGVRGKGFSIGVAVGDYDNDGFEDLYVAGVDHNQLLHNNGDGTFTDVTAKAGLEGVDAKYGKTWAMSAAWFDYDNDGYLDLIVVNYVNWSVATEPECKISGIRAYCSPNAYSGQPSMLFHNNGNGTFTDVSASSGIGKHIGKGMGVAIADYDGDGFSDIFVANDTFRNFLFHNNGNGTFSEVGIEKGIAYNENGKSIAGMGVDFRDIDNDGAPDVFVVGMVGDTFPVFLNRAGDFLDITTRSGVARASARVTAWGNGIFDFDNDGFKDLFATCASILDNSEEIDHLPSKLPNMVLRNSGKGAFTDVSASAGPDFRHAATHRGVAFGDLNNDGNVDAVVTVLNDRSEIFLNRSPGGNHWLKLRLTGTKSNRDGIGARIKIVPEGGTPQYNHVTTSVGLSSSSDRVVHFGLGRAARVSEVDIDWPSGRKQKLVNVSADQLMTVREP